MTSLAHNLKNDTAHDDYTKAVRKLGEMSAQGKDALPNLAVIFARAVYDQVEDPAKDPNGDDAAARAFKIYTLAEGKKAFHNRSAESAKVQVSKLRQIQKAASNPKYDFVDVLNRAITIMQKAIDDGVDVRSAYDAYVNVAREQLKQDDELDDAQLFAAVTPRDNSKEPTLEKELKKMQKIADGIITGEKHPGVFDQTPEMLAIGELLNEKIKTLLLADEKAKATEDAIKHGLITIEHDASDPTDNLELAANIAA